MSIWVLLALFGVLLVNIPQIQGRKLSERDEKGSDSEDAEENADESDDDNTKKATRSKDDERKIITRRKRGLLGSMMGGDGRDGGQGFLFGGHGGSPGQPHGMGRDILGRVMGGATSRGRQLGDIFGGVMGGSNNGGKQMSGMLGNLVSGLTSGK